MTVVVTVNGDKGEMLSKETNFYVSDSEDTTCVLLGRNFMQSFGTTSFNFDINKVNLEKRGVVVYEWTGVE